jgi:hypothetical protein
MPNGTPRSLASAFLTAARLVGVGETYDVEVAPADAARAAALLVQTRYYPGSPPVRAHEARVPVQRGPAHGASR